MLDEPVRVAHAVRARHVRKRRLQIGAGPIERGGEAREPRRAAMFGRRPVEPVDQERLPLGRPQVGMRRVPRKVLAIAAADEIRNRLAVRKAAERVRELPACFVAGVARDRRVVVGKCAHRRREVRPS